MQLVRRRARKGEKMGTGSGAGSERRAAAVVLFAGLLAGCGQASRPAPVVSATAPATTTIRIEPGQTLSGIALSYHVPMRELAALNHLSPPYKIFAGGELLLPPTAIVTAQAPGAPIGVAAAAPSVVETAPTPAETSPAPTVHTAGLAPPPAPSPHEVAAPAAGHPTSVVPASVETGPQAAHGTVFVWPVHGRIVERYGPGPAGTHNDGVNIAAPRGTPIEAAGAGVVAYAGDELRGYGNLILIKQPDGWISAYAHCAAILVKQGQKVAKGQVIARVGATGDVTAPQLHFELRRGDRPVDPQRYLPPLSSAATQPAGSG
jgi:murein DD-endopeptidase MepM/ murein hydrolase activator NlpD